jgi:type IV pilus assembly protein PilW
MKQNIDNKNGFTVIELMIAMVISAIVMIAIYAVFESQSRAYTTQRQLVDAEQSLRTSMYVLERDVRMAGCDPFGTADATLISAETEAIEFTMDVTGGDRDGEDNDTDGVTDADDPAEEFDEAAYFDGQIDEREHIRYFLEDDDNGSHSLMRDEVLNTDEDPLLVAENIDALNFVYLDENGNPTGVIDNIRSAQITVVCRTGRPDSAHTDTKEYKNQQDETILPAQNDNYHRRVLSTQVKFRNFGIEID